MKAPAPPRRLLRGARGVVLVEVLVATMLAMVVTAGVFIAILTSRTALGKSDTRTVAAAQAKLLMEQLGNYMTADHSGTTASMAPANSWDLPGGSGCGSGWALGDCGAHIADNLLPPEFKNKYSGQMRYSVIPGPNGSKQVTVTVTWVEP